MNRLCKKDSQNRSDLLVGGWTNPFEKHATIKMASSSPKVRGWIVNCSKICELPPPRKGSMFNGFLLWSFVSLGLCPNSTQYGWQQGSHVRLGSQEQLVQSFSPLRILGPSNGRVNEPVWCSGCFGVVVIEGVKILRADHKMISSTDRSPNCKKYANMLHVWNIYLHEWLEFMVNVHKDSIHGAFGDW